MEKHIVIGSFFFDDNKEICIVGFVDNNESLWGEEKEKIKIYAPSDIPSVEFDVIVLLSNQFYEEQKQQLLKLGISENVIWDFYDLKRTILYDSFKAKKTLDLKKNILIITYRFCLDGGSLAALYLAEALGNEDTNVCIATDHITKEAYGLAKKHGIGIIIYKSLPYMSDLFLEYINKYMYVIVNTLQMIPAAIELHNRNVPTCLWVHEGEELWYKRINSIIRKKDVPSDLNVLFVSDVSKSLYMKYYSSSQISIVPIGLPDRSKKKKRIDQSCFRIILITANSKNKNPALMVRALNILPSSYINRIRVDFYGLDEKGRASIESATKGNNRVYVNGVLSPSKIHEKIDEADCFICTSLAECLPTTAIEGFMHSCIVVVPESAGIVKYIRDRKNGYIYKTNDEYSLSRCIIEILDNKNNNTEIVKEARKTYENYFMYKSLKDAFFDVMSQNGEV